VVMDDTWPSPWPFLTITGHIVVTNWSGRTIGEVKIISATNLTWWDSH
jgi:hypothetical protein